MAITTRKLEVFLEVVEHTNFRLAADQLGISQPSVSAQISDLEMELGFALFHRRSGARPHLTEQGHGFVQRAKEMISAHASLRGEEGEPRVRRKKLVIAAGAALLELLRPELPNLILDHPEVDIEFESMTQIHSTLRAMDEQLVDIALHTGAVPRRSRGRVEIIEPVSYSVFASEAFAEQHMSLGRCEAAFPLILPPKGGWSTEPIRAMLAEAGVSTSQVVGRSAFPDVLLKLALSDAAAIVVPNDAVTDYVREGRLVVMKPNIGSGYRYMLVGPNARCAAGARVVEHLKDMVLTKRRTHCYKLPRDQGEAFVTGPPTPSPGRPSGSQPLAAAPGSRGRSQAPRGRESAQPKAPSGRQPDRAGFARRA